MERTNSPIFVERGNDFVLEEQVPMLDRLDIIEYRLKVLENKMDECCKSPNVSPRFRSSSISTNSGRTSGRTSPVFDNTAFRDMQKSLNDLTLLSKQQQQQQKGGKRKTKKNKRKNKKNRTRRYKK
tara:strand:+ start:1709 stop:2086 length:378 start_codon:yes stop_codon:yes gene_type:complete